MIKSRAKDSSKLNRIGLLQSLSVASFFCNIFTSRINFYVSNILDANETII